MEHCSHMSINARSQALAQVETPKPNKHDFVEHRLRESRKHNVQVVGNSLIMDQKTQVLFDAFANASAESRKPHPFPGLESVYEGRAGYSNPHAYVRSVQKCLSLKEGTEKGEWCELANKILEWKCAHPGDHLPVKAILDKVANSAL